MLVEGRRSTGEPDDQGDRIVAVAIRHFKRGRNEAEVKLAMLESANRNFFCKSRVD